MYGPLASTVAWCIRRTPLEDKLFSFVHLRDLLVDGMLSPITFNAD